MKRIAILTSSRADYGIYLPLLNALKDDPYFDLKIIVFGTHLSPFHGYTIKQIIKDGFEVPYQIESMLASDTTNAISTAMALTALKFADFWRDHQNDFDLVFCLGDRYEMFAAVTSAIPFNIQLAHLHGGERTLGAIDNIFRHAITLASKFHFVSCQIHADRVAQLTESFKNIFDIGSLSLHNLNDLRFLSKDEFLHDFGIDLGRPTILVTVHPETVFPEGNTSHANAIANALLRLEKYQVLITLPNADSNSQIIRKRFLNLPNESDNRITCHENLGKQGYFTAMKYCAFLLGNSSSGIIEAASFGKWVINLGTRQEGRAQSDNTFDIPFEKEHILQVINMIESRPDYSGTNIYYKDNVVDSIVSILKVSI